MPKLNDLQILDLSELAEVVGGRARSTGSVSATETNFLKIIDLADVKKRHHGPQPDPTPELGLGLRR